MIRIGIRAKIFVSMAIIVVTLTLAFAVVSIQQAETAFKKIVRDKAIASAHTLAVQSELGVYTESEALIKDAISAFEQGEDFYSAAVFNRDGYLLAQDDKSNIQFESLKLDEVALLRSQGDYKFVDRSELMPPQLVYYVPILSRGSVRDMLLGGSYSELAVESNVEQDEVLGYVEYSVHASTINRVVKELAVSILTIFSIFLLLSFIFAYMLTRRIIGPVEQLALIAKAVAEGDFSKNYYATNKDEVGELATSFNHMLGVIKEKNQSLSVAKDELELKVELRTQELAQLNENLMRSLQELKQAQEQLVQAGKMAALGELVAGVAHEINTPLGVGVTAASYLESSVRAYSKQYALNELSRSDFEKFLALALDSSSMILSNLNRAAAMVRTFKQVAVDQADEEKRYFNFRDYLNETVKSLRPKIKGLHDKIEINCADDLVVCGYPGALYQIVSNLIMNSLIHGFDDGALAGKITIDVEPKATQVMLCYRDNGRGIDVAYLNKIFDPFFTTRRGTGGTGLGMHIIYNIIVQKLAGTIRVESKLGEGVSFYIEFPVIIKRD